MRKDITSGILLVMLCEITLRVGILFKILDEIKHMDFLVLEHPLNEILDLETKQEEESDFDGDPTPNTPIKSSTPTKGKEVAKEYQP